MPQALSDTRPAARALLALACAALMGGAATAQTAQTVRPAQTAKTAKAAKAKKPAAKPAKAPAAPAKATAAAPGAAAANAGSEKSGSGKAGNEKADNPSAGAPAPAPAQASAAQTTAAQRQQPQQQPSDYIVAIVNSEPVTNQDVRAGVARVRQQLEQQGAPMPADEDLRRQVMERLVAERAQIQYARESGLSVDDLSLAQAELSIARQNQLASAEELHQRIKAEGMDVKSFRDDLRRQVLLARLREREIEPRLRIGDAEVDAFIREETGAQPGAPMLNLAMILVAVPEGASAEQAAQRQARAQQALDKIRAGEDFAQIARQYSDANQHGEDGGVLGLRAADGYPELFVRATRAARVGEVVGPVRSDAGFHLLKVIERKQSADLPEVKIPQTRVRHILLATGAQQSQQLALERARDLRRRIQSGQASFEDLAREYSQDGSAAEGGDLGWASPGQFVPEFEQAMNNLDDGQVSEPVPSRFGVHLIRVDARREHALSTAEQRELARNMLREKKAQEAFETWTQEVRGRAYVEYRDPPR